MRIYGGVTWGSLLTLVIAAILITVPQVPQPWLWSIPPTWIALMLLGVAPAMVRRAGTLPQMRSPPNGDPSAETVSELPQLHQSDEPKNCESRLGFECIPHSAFRIPNWLENNEFTPISI